MSRATPMKKFLLISAAALALAGCNASSTPSSKPAPPPVGTVVGIETHLPGASPEMVEVALTKPIESAVASLDGVEHVRSSNSLGRSYLEVAFKAKEQDRQLRQVQVVVEAVRHVLPTSASESMIATVPSPVLR